MYFLTAEERKATATVYAQCEKDVEVNENGCYWWLRSPGGFLQATASIEFSGSIDYHGKSVNYGVRGISLGVRPAMWITVQ